MRLFFLSSSTIDGQTETTKRQCVVFKSVSCPPQLINVITIFLFHMFTNSTWVSVCKSFISFIISLFFAEEFLILKAANFMFEVHGAAKKQKIFINLSILFQIGRKKGEILFKVIKNQLKTV